VTAAIANAGKAIGDLGLRAKMNTDLVENYIQKLDWRVKENSNMCYSLQGLNNFISSHATSQYWLNRVYFHWTKIP
jgi:ABC-type Zn uptake system ZnuABC Zn-binding protein ZnuA